MQILAHLTKDKVIKMASMLDKMDPEVAKKALEQFPEFANTTKEMLTEYKVSLDKGLESNNESVKAVYDTYNAIITSLVPQTAGLWYHEKAGEAEKLELRIEELKFEKSQYEEKKREIKKPKGMKSGLIIFIIFSILGVFFPLVCALIDCTYNYSCLCVPIISLGLFVICVLVTFIYLALLLSWKDVDKEVNNHESSGSESEL